jgi:hypothetical protein
MPNGKKRQTTAPFYQPKRNKKMRTAENKDAYFRAFFSG